MNGSVQVLYVRLDFSEACCSVHQSTYSSLTAVLSKGYKTQEEHTFMVRSNFESHFQNHQMIEGTVLDQ